MWKVASALGNATFLRVSCAYVHLMILVATTFGAVQLKYGVYFPDIATCSCYSMANLATENRPLSGCTC
eukprot:3211965-Pyramimonas_sp.AAC.1